jgi:hypothetical protein
MQMGSRQITRRIVEYDAIRHRLWILGQRCHHGATGGLVAALACVGIAADTAQIAAVGEKRGMLALAVTGGALMAHDWKDRAIWFERGRGTQR